MIDINNDICMRGKYEKIISNDTRGSVGSASGLG